MGLLLVIIPAFLFLVYLIPQEIKESFFIFLFECSIKFRQNIKSDNPEKHTHSLTVIVSFP